MHAKRLLTLILLLSASTTAAPGQNLNETLSGVGDEYARLYVEPLVDALGADLNTGLFHSADMSRGIVPAFDLYAGVRVPASLVSSSARTFDLTYQDTHPIQVEYEGRRQTVRIPVTFRAEDAPTVFGSEDTPILTARAQGTATVVDEQGNSHEVAYDTTITVETIGGLVDTRIAPIAVPHVSVGSFRGTDVMIRYLPEISQEDYGSLSMWGIGLRHDIDQYIPGLPIELAVQAVRQDISVSDDTDDDLADINAYALNVAASKTIAVLTVYGGLQWESSTVDITYLAEPVDDDPDAEPVEISFEQSGANSFRVLGGVSLGLGPVVINANYSVGRIQVVSGGIGFAL